MPYKTFLSTNSMYKILLFFSFVLQVYCLNFLGGFSLNLGVIKAYVLLLINVISLLTILEDCYTIMKKHWICISEFGPFLQLRSYFTNSICDRWAEG